MMTKRRVEMMEENRENLIVGRAKGLCCWPRVRPISKWRSLPKYSVSFCSTGLRSSEIRRVA